MYLYRNFICPTIIRNVFTIRQNVGILSMKRHFHLYSSVFGIVPLTVKCLRLIQSEITRKIGSRIERNQTSGNISLYATVRNSFGHSILEHIHIRKRYRSAAYHLGTSKHCSPIYCFVGKLVLRGEYLLVQPPGQGQTVSNATEKSHCGMAVCIIKSRNNHRAVALLDQIKLFLGTLTSHVKEMSAVNSNKDGFSGY